MSFDSQKVSIWWFSLNSVQRSLMLSLLVHLIVIFGFWLGAFSTAEKMMAKVMPELIDMQALKEAQEKRRSVIFLEVPPSMATQDAPDDSKHYSNNNSKAADQQSEKDTEKPKIDGKQELIDRVIDSAANAKPANSQPKEENQAQPKEEPKPKVKTQSKSVKAESLNPIQISKPNPKPKDQTKSKVKPKPKPKRPSSLAEARRMAMVTGEKMKQEGGVRNKATIEGLDAKASPFGDYDARLIASIQNRWHNIIPSVREVGRVIVTFNLWENGEVTDIEIERSTVSSILSLKCERAIKEPGPYDPWPDKMREIIGNDRRFVRFTFYYN
ncbi:MAG: cell envelope integrity protein TolA [Verrucomicrobiota bacterium]|nr:cell envelope integrity protein TolA [Verrucomicrobiota bacterium]